MPENPKGSSSDYVGLVLELQEQPGRWALVHESKRESAKEGQDNTRSLRQGLGLRGLQQLTRYSAPQKMYRIYARVDLNRELAPAGRRMANATRVDFRWMPEGFEPPPANQRNTLPFDWPDVVAALQERPGVWARIYQIPGAEDKAARQQVKRAGERYGLTVQTRINRAAGTLDIYACWQQ